MGVGFPRTGHRRLTVLLAFTVTSSTSSCVSPRITGGAGKERRKRQGIDGLGVNMVEVREAFGTRCSPEVLVSSSLNLSGLEAATNYGLQRGHSLFKVTQ